MSMITATAWVPRGFAAPFPTKYILNEEEFKRISELAKLQLDDAKEGLNAARNGAKATEEMSDEDGSNQGDGKNAVHSKESGTLYLISKCILH
jgi:periodic tryptophan protein 1